jgi:hypothetical protein
MIIVDLLHLPTALPDRQWRPKTRWVCSHHHRLRTLAGSGRGLARDMRVRWALEEVGQPYDVRLVSFAEMKEPAHRALPSLRADPDL